MRFDSHLAHTPRSAVRQKCYVRSGSASTWLLRDARYDDIRVTEVGGRLGVVIQREPLAGGYTRSKTVHNAVDYCKFNGNIVYTHQNASEETPTEKI